MTGSVLFDARLVLKHPTGIGRYIASLVPELVRQAPGTTFHLLRGPDPWPGYGLDELEAPNLVHHVWSLRHMTVRQHLDVPRAASELGVDLLHYPHFDAPVDLARVPVVATVHDTKELPSSEFEGDLPFHKRAALRFLLRRTLRNASAIITVSRATAEALDALLPGSSSRVSVVHLAADPSFSPVDEEEARGVTRARGLERPYVLTVSERRPHKNIEGLLRAYAASTCRETHDLVVVGRPWRSYRGPETAVEALDLSGRAHILSDVSHSELVALYTAADAFALVSFYEGFGLPILEAMACGTPVLASGVSATGEVLGDAGLTIDPHDDDSIAAALDRLTGDRALRADCVERGFARASAFTWERAARETLDVYERAAGDPRQADERLDAPDTKSS